MNILALKTIPMAATGAFPGGRNVVVLGRAVSAARSLPAADGLCAPKRQEQARVLAGIRLGLAGVLRPPADPL